MLHFQSSFLLIVWIHIRGSSKSLGTCTHVGGTKETPGSRLLTSEQPISGHCGHLASEPEDDERSLSLILPFKKIDKYVFLFKCQWNKIIPFLILTVIGSLTNLHFCYNFLVCVAFLHSVGEYREFGFAALL